MHGPAEALPGRPWQWAINNLTDELTMASPDKKANGKGSTMTIIDLISLTERLHRRFIALVKVALEELGVTDINATQAAMLCQIGDGVSSLRDLRTRGYYHGTNPAYNVQKLVRAGYLVRGRRGRDRRSIGVRLTDRGKQLRDELIVLHCHQIQALTQYGMSKEELERAGTILDRLERFITVARRSG